MESSCRYNVRLMEYVVREIIDIHEIWPDTEVSILLIFASVDGAKPFAIWAERKQDNTTFFTKKYFENEQAALTAFSLLSQVLIEINDPAIAFLKNISTTDPQ